MPCYEPRGGGVSYGQFEDVKKQEEKYRSSAKQYEGALCAIIHELDALGLTEKVLSQASKKGLIDIMEWWQKHNTSDHAKMANDIHHRYSTHELDMIKKILKDH